MATGVFSYLLFEPLDPKELSLLKDLTTAGRAWGPLGQCCGSKDGGETRCGKLGAGQLEEGPQEVSARRALPGGARRLRDCFGSPGLLPVPGPPFPKAHPFPLQTSPGRSVRFPLAGHNQELYWKLQQHESSLRARESLVAPRSLLYWGEGVSERLGVANSKSDGSFFCFPEICKVWEATSNYIRRELLEKRVSLTSCLWPRLPLCA